MSFTQDDVYKIAHLARIGVTNNSTFSNSIAGNLVNILKLVDQIQEIDTTGISPMAHPLDDLHQPLRTDDVTETDVRKAMQEIAPSGGKEAGLYLVPKVVNSEG